MDIEARRALLRAYRRERENTNANPVGESTGRTYIAIPPALKEAGAQARLGSQYCHR
jgi:hypothetical protein